jgi:hypothetical protein
MVQEWLKNNIRVPNIPPFIVLVTLRFFIEQKISEMLSFYLREENFEQICFQIPYKKKH